MAPPSCGVDPKKRTQLRPSEPRSRGRLCQALRLRPLRALLLCREAGGGGGGALAGGIKRLLTWGGPLDSLSLLKGFNLALWKESRVVCFGGVERWVEVPEDGF